MPTSSELKCEFSSAEFFSMDGIFSLTPLSSFKSSALTNLQICGNYAVAATGKNTILRFSLNDTSSVTETEITKLADDRVHNLFLDPMGWHTIISMQSGMNFYTNRGMKKVKPLTKAKDLLIDSVAWNRHNVDQASTQEILLGTNDGIIYETLLLSDEGRFISSVVEQYWRQMVNLGHSINGLEVIRFSPGSSAVLVGEPQRCVILATTPGRMYQFAGWISSVGTSAKLSQFNSGSPPTGSPVPQSLGVNSGDSAVPFGSTTQTGLFPITSTGIFHSVFSPDDKLPSGNKVTEFPHSFGYSDLKLYQPPDAELPDRFAWMTGPGIYFGYLKSEQLALPPFSMAQGKLSNSRSTFGANDNVTASMSADLASFDGSESQDVFAGRGVNLTRNTKLIPYPLLRMVERPGTPLGICLTGFHVIVVYADRVKAVNLLDDRTICSLSLISELGNGRALGICRDPIKETIWIFGSQGVAQLNVNNEMCRIWQIYLDRAQFDLARRYCQNEGQLDVVNIREAEHCFNQRDFVRSASLFAKTSVPFEELALRFSQLSFQQNVSLSPVQQGLAVVNDHDVMNAIIHGVDGLGAVRMPKLMSGESRSKLGLSVASSMPLKALILSRLTELIENQSLTSRGAGNSRIDFAHSHVKNSKVSQVTLLTLWLAELLLSEAGFLRDSICKQENGAARLEAASTEFRQLLTRPEVLGILPDIKGLLYELIENYGNHEEMVFVTELMGDYSRLVDHYMSVGMYKEALKTFASEITCADRMYDHAVTLALTEPEAVVSTWLRLGMLLNPSRLLPAILLLTPSHALHYLETMVHRHNCEQQAIHHLLIWLYAQKASNNSMFEKDDDDVQDCLTLYLKTTNVRATELAHLDSETSNVWELPQNSLLNDHMFQMQSATAVGIGNDLGRTALPYDPGFALRICKEVDHLHGTIFLLKLLGMHHQALQIALHHNNNTLAKQVAGSEMLSKETRRVLWIELARYAITKQSRPQEATHLLRECPLLNLEDILPCFHEFITIDEFKDAICTSLDSYHERIEQVRRETKLTMKSMNALRKQLDDLRYRYEILDANDRCGYCNHLLFVRSFNVFSCGHFFHSNCLVELNFDSTTTDDCPTCGKSAIQNIDNFFISDCNKYQSELQLWE